LPLLNFKGRKRTLAPFAAAIAAGLLSPSLVMAGVMAGAPAGQIGAPDSGMRQFAPAAPVEAPRIHVAQSQEAAQLTVRIQQLEEQIRSLTGQVEGLQFQLTQMQTLIERQTQDNEFRFQQLEGGAGKKSDAATQSDGVTPSGALPQDTNTAPVQSGAPTVTPEGAISPLPGEAEIDPTFNGGTDAPVQGGDAPMDDIGSSSDPLLGTGQGQTGVPLGSQLPQVDGSGVARPLDLSLGGGAQPANGDAAAQYAAGYDAIVRGDYAFAEEQFRQFVALYPDDPNAADATNWLGEALIQRAAYDEAADVLLTGYQKYPSSTRAPDLLLKLGISLGGAGELDTACRTFAEVEKRYTNLTPAFLQRLGEEKAKVKCQG
jgi:tol-pal system protein YbgF